MNTIILRTTGQTMIILLNRALDMISNLITGVDSPYNNIHSKLCAFLSKKYSNLVIIQLKDLI